MTCSKADATESRSGLATVPVMALAAAMALLAGMSWWAGNSSARHMDAMMRAHLLRRAAEIGHSLNPELAQQLTFTGADKGTPAFEQLREQMIAVARASGLGVWSAACSGDRLAFGPESYPAGHPFASLPGTVYQRPPAEFLEVFKDRRPTTAGPYTDEHGTRVTAYVPVLDPHSGKLAMVVGTDMPAADWQARLSAARRKPALAAFALGGVLLAGFAAVRWHNRHRGPNAAKFRNWIVVPAGLAMLAGLMLHGANEYRQAAGGFRQGILSTTEQARSQWTQRVFSQVQLLRAQADHVEQIPALLAAWRNRDFSKLQALAGRDFERFRREHRITHFYFIAPDRTCLLRVHQPSRQGDLISRSTLLAAQRTSEDAWGAELGPLGTFTLRYVRPWKQDGAVIGYLELGMEIEHLVTQLAGEMNLELLTIIRKAHTTREAFEAGRRVFGFAGQWDAHRDFVVAHQTMAAPPPHVLRWLESEHGPADDDVMLDARLGDRRFFCGRVHLADAAGRQVADLVVMRDVTAQTGAARSDLAMNLSLAAVLFGGVLALLWSVAGTAERQLSAASARLRQSEERLSATLRSIGDGVVSTDVAGNVTDLNAVAEALTGWSSEEALGRPVTEVLRLVHSQTRAEAENPVPRVLAEGRVLGLAQHTALIARDGTERQIDDSCAPICSAGGRIVGAVLTFRDITARKAMEDELRLAARTDKLTGLPNRALFCDRLQQAVVRASRLKGYCFAVLFLDFDRFKVINDCLGHDVGDLLLQEIAQRMRRAVRGGDSVSRDARDHTTARLGGDEFVVLLDGLASPHDAVAAADRLLAALADPYELGEHRVFSTASIGIVTSDIAADSAEQVLRDADTAMYEAKLAGKARHVLFDVSMRQRVQERMDLENALRTALEAGELFLMYQPIVSLHTGRIESFEALLRWKHPKRGLIPPAEFVPIAEECGLILPIGEWVLREACGQFARWQESMGEAAPPSISVNLSRAQLLLQDLPRTIQRILDQTGMRPSCLHLEITESAVAKDVETATRILHAIKSTGVKLDMDDFGTGYSSMAFLHQFPIDVLKIDRSFVANIERGRDFAALVHAVAQLAHNLNISVVAEGIETVDQALILQSLECEFGQGYLFSRPIMGDAVPGFSVPPGVLPGIAAAQLAS